MKKYAAYRAIDDLQQQSLSYHDSRGLATTHSAFPGRHVVVVVGPVHYVQTHSVHHFSCRCHVRLLDAHRVQFCSIEDGTCAPHHLPLDAEKHNCNCKKLIHLLFATEKQSKLSTFY